MIYNDLGFKHVRDNQPSIWWSRGEKKVISDTLLRQRGYDQLFKTNYGKGTSNHDLMLEHSWRPVYDCGQSSYEFLQKKGRLSCPYINTLTAVINGQPAVF